MANWLRFKYSWAPILSAVVWAATLIALFVLWRIDGPPWYKQNRTVLFISYAGNYNYLFSSATFTLYFSLHRSEQILSFHSYTNAGSKWKGVFVPGAVLTSIFYVITLVLDVELRRHERIPNFLQRRDAVSNTSILQAFYQVTIIGRIIDCKKIFAILSIVFGTIAAIALSGLAIFDVHNFHSAHWAFTALFIVDVFLNGLFNLFEIKYLSRGHYQLGYLRRNAFAKLIISSIALGISPFPFFTFSSFILLLFNFA
jgi:hypothetical protein